ncbi:retrovirus-related pol polyprotein from transposon TNT 1-94 [Tanacetum coccineum]
MIFYQMDTEEEGKSNDDWDNLLDFNIDDIPLLGEEGLPPFVCKMGKSRRNKKRAMENLNFFYQDIGTSSSACGHLTQEEAAKKELSNQNEPKKILDEVWKDNVELDGKIIKEEEEAVKRIKGEALKEKDDPGAFIFPIRLEGHVNKNALEDTGSDINTMPYRIYNSCNRDIKKVDRGITMINHTQAEAMGILTNVLCQVGVTTLIAKFLILDIPIDRDSPIVVGRGFLHVMRNIESDSDDKEDYQIKINKFGALVYGPKPAPYLNCNDPAERSLAIETVTNLFWKISVWKKAVGFLGSLPVPLKNVNWKPDYKGSYTKEEEATGQWRTEIRLQEHTMMRPDHQDPNAQDNMKPWKKYCFHKFTMSSCYGKDVTEMQSLEIDDMLRIRLREDGSDEEIFISVAWIRAFNINEPIYTELCHEFYSTYECDEVCADDELQTKKIIKFRLGGRAHSLTLLEFAQRLGLYQAVELEEEGFNVYFEGGLRSDEHFNAQDYWTTGYDKVQKNDLWLLSMFDARHQNSQVKDNKIDLLVQQYEQFVISEDESIDSAFARFNTIITSLKALDEGYSSKNYVRKFLRALHPKWRPNKICLGVDLEPDEWIKDSGCSKHMTGNRKLFSTYKAYNGGNVIFGSNLRGNIIVKVIEQLRHSIGMALKMAELKVEELLNMTFDETSLPSKTSPLVDDDLDKEEAIKVTEKKNLENNIEDETLVIDEIVNIKESRNHPLENVIGNLNQRTLISEAQNQCNFFCFISTIEPKNMNEALADKSWIVIMQEELNQFIANNVWELVPQLRNMTIIGTKWVFRNKLDENGIVSRNKTRLVAQGYNQQEIIDYDETYAPVARLGSIRILLAYACALDFKLFQMNVKIAFLNGFINEEVYVAQPLGFIDFEKLDHFYKLKKALYGLKQVPKAWKFGLEESKPMKTPMSSDTKLTKDEECESIDSTKYQGMISSLLYLTTSRPDIIFSVCLCALFQEAPKTSHLEAVKRIFRYIKGTTHLGLWYHMGTDIEIVVYADSDHAGDYVD